MLGVFPMGNAIGLLSSHSPSHGEHASSFITEKAFRSLVRSLQQRCRRRRRPNRHHSIFAAASIRPLPATDRNRSPIGRQSILSRSPFFAYLPPLRNSDRRTVERTDRKGSVQQSLIRSTRSAPLLDLTRATLPPYLSLSLSLSLSLAVLQCISDRFRLYSDI